MTKKIRKRKPAIPGGRYSHRWKVKQSKEAAMTDEEKTYRDQLVECVGELDQVRISAPLLNGTEIGRQVGVIADKYRPETRPTVTDQPNPQVSDDRTSPVTA